MQTLNDGFLALLMSVGHRTGLFDTMRGLPPATSQPADRGCRQSGTSATSASGSAAWSSGGSWTTTQRLQPITCRQSTLPSWTRAAGLNNMAFISQLVGLTGLVEGQLVECFRNGGGVPYSAYPEFQAIQAEESGPLYDTALVSTMLPLVPGIVERLEAGIDAADVGCGQGHAVNVMAQAFPNSRFVGYDFSEEGVAAGRAEAERLGLTNARFEVRDVADLGTTAQFGLVTAFDTIHDQARPLQVLRSIIDSVQPGGDFLMMDMAASSKLEENIEHPMGPLLYAASTFHCMTVSLAQGGEGLGTVWGEQTAAEYLGRAGFSEIEAKHLDGDFFHVLLRGEERPAALTARTSGACVYATRRARTSSSDRGTCTPSSTNTHSASKASGQMLVPRSGRMIPWISSHESAPDTAGLPKVPGRYRRSSRVALRSAASRRAGPGDSPCRRGARDGRRQVRPRRRTPPPPSGCDG